MELNLQHVCHITGGYRGIWHIDDPLLFPDVYTNTHTHTVQTLGKSCPDPFNSRLSSFRYVPFFVVDLKTAEGFALTEEGGGKKFLVKV